eukprot:1298235-Rhodomonas_salina.1
MGVCLHADATACPVLRYGTGVLRYADATVCAVLRYGMGVPGKDTAALTAYLDPLNYLEDGGQDAVMSKEELAVVHATVPSYTSSYAFAMQRVAAVQLASDPLQRAEAKAVMGEPWPMLLRAPYLIPATHIPYTAALS